MNIIKKIRQILSNEKLDLADKIIEIEGCLPKEKEVEIGEIFGQTFQIKSSIFAQCIWQLLPNRCYLLGGL